MRYGLQFADGNPFPQNVDLGVQLQDETSIVVPEACPECPECPDVACTPAFIGWEVIDAYVNGGYDFQYAGGVNLVTCEELEAVEPDVYFEPGGEMEAEFIIMAPKLTTCGHRTRIVFDPGTLTGDYEYATSNGAGGADAGFALIYMLHPYLATGIGSISVQIDLTDAEVGSETWTDIGCAFSFGHQ